MRIAHVTVTYPPHNTGTANVARHNALELVRLGHEVHVYTTQEPNAQSEEVLESVTVHRLRPWLRYGNAAFLPQLLGVLPDFDIVHLHMPFYGGSEAVALLKRLRDIPLVITHHQDVSLSGPIGAISASHDRLIGRYLMQAADRVAFTSLDYAKASRYADLLAAGRIRAVELPNGVDPDRFTPGERPGYLERRHGLVGRRVILFVGVLDRAHYFKGVPVLLQAMSQLDRADVTLIVVGEGDMRAAYQAAARELGLADRVHFAGFVPDDDLPDYYRLADVTVLPSTTMGEAFGLVLVESLAGGTPVIASALPGVRTVVTPDRDGYLTTPGDVSQLAHKLSQILSLSADRRRAMGLAGRRKVRRRYAWRQIGTRLVGLYRAVVSQRQDQAMSSSIEAAT